MNFIRTCLHALGFLLALSAFSIAAPETEEAPPPYKLKIAVVEGRDLEPRDDRRSRYISRLYQLGTAEILAIDLRKVEGFYVIDREQVHAKLKSMGKRKTLQEASRRLALELGADQVVQVEYRFLPKQWLELHLVTLEPRKGTRLVRLKTAQAPQKDLFKMLDEFVLVLAEEQGRPLNKQTLRQVQQRSDISIDAWHRYTRGVEFYYEKNQNALILAHEQLRKAEKHDILFLPTYIAQARVYLYEAQQNWGPQKVLLDKAQESAQKALFIDSKYLDGYEILAEVYFSRKDYVTCVRECLKAIRLNPLSMKARVLLAKSYQALGKKEEAARELDKMLEIDPAFREALKLRQKGAPS